MKGYYKKGRRFVNPHIDSTKRSLLDIALWQLGFYNDQKKPKARPEKFKYPNRKRKLKENAPKVTWINHCTFLVEVGGLRLLTDPIWGERCSPLSFLGPKRRHLAPLSLESLPEIDIVLISHDHYDHLCRETVLKLQEQNPGITWVVPLGVKKRLRKLGVRHILEMEWWQEAHLGIKGQEVIVTAVPSQHFSGRGVFDRNTTLWSGYVVDFLQENKQEKRLYFVGDTGYNQKDFKKIGKRFGEMDLSLIPIGTYVPGRFMQPVHICPTKAAKIHAEVGSLLSIGMHWKTFRLSSESLEQPPYDLYCALKKQGIDPKKFRVLEPGQTINW
ncbi:MAG: MBL fold metallo-hydrolase [Chlamydiia bacterium]|nr:MBL fold metallo-hydrolase [Chlamydiia bacterium]